MVPRNVAKYSPNDAPSHIQRLKSYFHCFPPFFFFLFLNTVRCLQVECFLCCGGLGFVSWPVDRLPWLFLSCLQTHSRTAPLVTSRPRPWTSRQFGLPFDAIRYVLLMALLNNAPISGTIRWQHQPTHQTEPSQHSVGKKPPYRNFCTGHPVVFSEL